MHDAQIIQYKRHIMYIKHVETGTRPAQPHVQISLKANGLSIPHFKKPCVYTYNIYILVHVMDHQINFQYVFLHLMFIYYHTFIYSPENRLIDPQIGGCFPIGLKKRSIC